MIDLLPEQLAVLISFPEGAGCGQEEVKEKVKYFERIRERLVGNNEENKLDRSAANENKC